VAQSLATHGVIDPVFAAWLPNLGMSLLALWFFVRLR
jgi:lipopolysaccharide export LptBFGC system permease protein LptF